MFGPFFLYTLIIIIVQCNCDINKPNVCRTMKSYHHLTKSPNCYYTEDAELKANELITKYAGNASESHRIITEDGYILTMFRIRRENPKGVVLIHHSVATNSRIFVWNGPDSFAFLLWNNGYDVWLANHRGTEHSDLHVNLTNHDLKYWNFGVDEIAIYDIPAELNYIKHFADQKVIFLGHSLGAVTGLIHAATFPREAAALLKTYILIGPPGIFIHNDNFLHHFLPLYKTLQRVVARLRVGDVAFALPVLLPLGRLFLSNHAGFIPFFNYCQMLILGWTPDQSNPLFFNIEATISLQDFSWMTLFHFMQWFNVKSRFQRYDYEERNFEMYGTQTPPLYPVENITLPIHFMSSTSDRLVNTKDVDYIYKMMPTLSSGLNHTHTVFHGLNHIGFLCAKNNFEFYLKFLQFINEI